MVCSMYDFDPKVQEIFHAEYTDIPHTAWRTWLTFSSRKEYESAAVTLSGLSEIDDLANRMRHEKTDPKSLSVDVHSLQGSPLILCHTSGTSGGSVTEVKWFYMSKELVTRLWAPGMQAIFEASGLTSQNSAVIFVPSRARTDGISTVDEKTVVQLYSAEFSQRLVLSMIQPRSYLLYQYKDAYTVPVLARLLSMDNISVVSAPFLTVLGWTNLKKLRNGLEKSLKIHDDAPEVLELKKMINKKGVKEAAVTIQRNLSHIFKDATLIFSATGMTEKEWGMLRHFLQWEKGKEKFTNLYVGSEVGPFAASIGSTATMYVFPLTVPVVETKGEYTLISQTTHATGNLFVSRMHNSNPAINIVTGDVITVTCQEGLPTIKGEILRAPFPLKTDLVLSPAARINKPYTVLVGTYFDVNGMKIKNPRRFISCLAEKCNLEKPVVLKKDKTWVMVVSGSEDTCSLTAIEDVLRACSDDRAELTLQKGQLHITKVDEPPVHSRVPRSELVAQVKRGELPKGVLMQWPLYVVIPSDNLSRVTYT